MSYTQRCLSMVKGRHRYVFRCAEGCESELLATFVALANDPHSGFDFFDAAVLSYQLGQQLSREFAGVAHVQ